MLLRVELPQGSYIADVGFGLLTLTAPLRLRPELEQATPHGLNRLVGSGDEFQLQLRLADNWAPVYQFSLQEQVSVDWEVQNWYTSTHPDSTFTNSLMEARPVGELRYALLNDRLSVHHPDDTVERRTARGVSELAFFLQTFFDIRLPSGADEFLRPRPSAAEPLLCTASLVYLPLGEGGCSRGALTPTCSVRDLQPFC